MSVSTANGVSATVVQPAIYRGAVVPTLAQIGDLWEDTSTSPPVLKQCTAVPNTFSAVGGGGGGGADFPVNTNITSMTGLTGGIATPDYIQFDTGASVTPTVGRLGWDVSEHSLSILLTGGNVNLQVGQETVVRVYNQTGSALTDGQVVYCTGSQGQRLTVALAQANSDATSAAIIGVVTEPIPNNSEGFITVQGTVHGLDTSAYTDGQVIYLSPTTAGAWTTTKPQAPQHLVLVGYIVKGGSVGAGSIYVHVQNGYELDELHDVKITSIANGNVLQYDNTIPAWKNITPPWLTTEVDPVYTASSWYTTTNNSTNWNTAYGWGNHASAGYLLASTASTTYQPILVSGTNIKTINGSSILGSGNLTVGGSGVTSVDVSVPVGLTSTGGPITSTGTIAISYTAGYSIPTTANQTNWSTAYGWGNHATAGYLLASTAATTYQPLSTNLTNWSSVATTAKQDTLVSGTSIKTVNSNSLLGSGNVAVQDTLVSGTNIKTINGASVLGSGNLTVSGSGSPVVTATIDFGATPLAESSFTITDASITSSSYIQVFVMADSTADNDADAHRHAAASWKLTALPTTGSFTLYVTSLIDLCWGTFKVRYTYS